MKTEFFTLEEDGKIYLMGQLATDDSETEVSNQDEVMMQIFRAHQSQHLIRGTPYPLQCHVEKKQHCETNGDNCPIYDSILHKTVALVTFSEPEEDDDIPEDFRCDCAYPCDGYPECGGVRVTFPSSAGVEETQEELSELTKHFYTDDNPWRDIYMDFKEGEGWLNFTERMSKRFTITRTNK